MSGFPVGKYQKEQIGAPFQRFCPSRSCLTLFDIDPLTLADEGKRLVLLDVDNTILPWRSEEIPEATTKWIAACKALGLEVCLISNTRHPARLERLGAKLEVIPFRGRFKPHPSTYLAALKHFGRMPEEAVMIGDQIFTDIWGANRAGIEAIWIRPLTPRDFVGTKVSRLGERLLRPILRRAMQAKSTTEPLSKGNSFFEKPVVRQFVKFALVGGSSMVIDLGLHYVLMFVIRIDGEQLSSYLGSRLLTSFPQVFSFAKDAPAAAFPILKILSAGCAILNGFYWNRRWTFSIDTPEDRVRHFHRYAIVALMGMLWNTLITTGLNNIISGHPKMSWAVASAVATVIVAFWNFSGTKFWAFRDKK